MNVGKGRVAWSTGTLALCWDGELVKKAHSFGGAGSCCRCSETELKLDGAKRVATGVTISVNTVKQVYRGVLTSGGNPGLKSSRFN